jgi:hypothetical protein
MIENTEIVIQDKATLPFAILQKPLLEIKDAIVANLGESRVTAGELDRIKIPPGGGTSWTVEGLDGEETLKELSGIIVAWRDTRVYWSVPMEESAGSAPPDCSSLDARIGVGKPGGDCLRCPLAQFGSDDGGVGQACKLVRQLFLVRENNLLPVVVHLPPSSIKPAKQYLMRLASLGVPTYHVVTNIGLEKTKNQQGIAYSRARFTSGGKLPADLADQVKQYASMIGPFLKSVPTIVETGSAAAEGEII